MTLLDSIKSLIVSTFTMLLAYLAPIQSIMFTVLFVFLANFIAGYAYALANREAFSLRKAFRTVTEVLVYYLILVCVFVVGERMNADANALQAITFITYTLIYFYAVNILRNLDRLFGGSNRAIAFLLYVVSLEVVKRVPFLSDFLNKEHNDKSGDNK